MTQCWQTASGSSVAYCGVGWFIQCVLVFRTTFFKVVGVLFFSCNRSLLSTHAAFIIYCSRCGNSWQNAPAPFGLMTVPFDVTSVGDVKSALPGDGVIHVTRGSPVSPAFPTVVSNLLLFQILNPVGVQAVSSPE